MDDKKQKLADLENQLNELKSTLPEHCFGTKGYVDDHHASPEHIQKIEDLEEEIEKLKTEIGMQM